MESIEQANAHCKWLPRGGELFRGMLPQGEHIVQLYEGETELLNTLDGFVRGGLQRGEGVIVIGTAAHLADLEDRLVLMGLDVATARFQERYVTVDSADILFKMLNGDGTDEAFFTTFSRQILSRARGPAGRTVRAFGELSAIIWERDFHGAALFLERLWHELCQKEGLTLYCAYPRSILGTNGSGWSDDVGDGTARDVGDGTERDIDAICSVHSTVIS